MDDQWRTLTQGELDAFDPVDFYSPEPRPANSLQRLLIGLARNTFLHRGKLRHLMTKVIMATGGQSAFDVSFRDCTFRIDGRKNLVEYGLLLSPAYNHEDIDFLLGGLQNGGIAVDIGSNIGLYALPLAKSADRVICIDPNPIMVRRCEFNARASDIENLSIHQVAVSDEEGSARLSIRKEDLAIVRIEPDTDGNIAVRTLKSILAEENITSIASLKIDVEGFEDQVLVPLLKEGGAILPKLIVIEHAKGVVPAGCAAMFDELGYVEIGRSKNNAFYRLGRSCHL